MDSSVGSGGFLCRLIVWWVVTCYNGFIGRFRGISMQVDCLVGGAGLLVSKETYVVLCVEG